VHPLGDDPEQAVAEFASEGTLLNGSPYRNTYLALSVVRDGKIRYWQEFSDPAPPQRGLTVMQTARATA
jgi:ketosteroid isomerase-like protein